MLRPREEHAGQKPTGLVAAGFLNPEEKSAQHTLRHIPKNMSQREGDGVYVLDQLCDEIWAASAVIRSGRQASELPPI